MVHHRVILIPSGKVKANDLQLQNLLWEETVFGDRGTSWLCHCGEETRVGSRVRQVKSMTDSSSTILVVGD